MFDHVTPIGWAVLGCLGIVTLANAAAIVVWISQHMSRLRRGGRHG